VPVSFDPDTGTDLAYVGETTCTQLGASHSAQCVQTDQLWAFDTLKTELPDLATTERATRRHDRAFGGVQSRAMADVLANWFGVRCVFELDPEMGKDTDPRVFEERISI
jgi:hypothetical protein